MTIGYGIYFTFEVHRRKYIKDFKIEIVESVLKGSGTLEVARENEIYPGLITKWKRQYLSGEFHGTSASDIGPRKLKLKIYELEQMVGKLTMENYILKKRERIHSPGQKKASSIITGPCLPQSRRDVS